MNDLQRVTANGIELCFRTGGNGGQTLLLLHTLRTQMEYHDRVMELIGDRFEVYMVDLPGHGRSQKDPARTHDAGFFIDTVTAFVDAVGLTDAIVMGESIGGTIALTLAARIPSKLSSVFAYNPYDSNVPFIGGWRGAMVSFFGKYATVVTKAESPTVLAGVLGGGLANPKNLPASFVQSLLDVPHADPQFATVMKNVLRQAPSWSEAADRFYPQVSSDVETHVIYGDRDWAPAAARDKTRKRLQNSNATFHELADTGHFSFLDNPDGAVAVMRNVVGDVERAR